MFHIMSQFNSSDGTPRQGACCWSSILNSLVCIAQSHWDEGACCALWASRCDFRDPGWGDPGFPQRDVLFLHLPRAPCDCDVFVFVCFTPLRKAQFFSTQAAFNLHRAILSNMTLFSCSLCCVFCFLLFVFVCGVRGCLFVCFSVLCCLASSMDRY